MKKDSRKEVGRIGEQLAVEHLLEKEWIILQRNWSARWGELDIIAQEAEMIVFVEVRTTTGRKFGYGFQSIDYRKQQKVRRLATYFIQKNRLEHRKVRFDVISVLLNGNCVQQDIHHIVGAF